MDTIIAELKKWGNSAGIIIPVDMMKTNNLSIGEEIEMTIKKENGNLQEFFGSGKATMNKSAEKAINEFRKEFKESKWI